MKLKLVALTLLLTAETYGMTLSEAVKTALSKNNQLLAKKFELKEKEHDLKIAKKRLWPTLELYSEFNKSNDPMVSLMNKIEAQKLNPATTDFNDPGTSQLFKTGIKATVPLWLGGKLRTAVSLSKKEVKATKEQLSKEKEKVVFDVVRAYFNVLTAKAYLETASLAVKDAERHLEDAKVAYKAGFAVKSDVLRAKVYLESVKENLVKAESNYEIAKRALALAIGLSGNEPVDVDGNLNFKEFNVDLNEAIKVAIENRSELKELKLRLSQTKDLKDLAKSDFMPQFVLFGEYFLASDNSPIAEDNTAWTIGLKASINLFDGGVKFEKLRKAKTSELKIKEYMERAKKGIEFEVARAYYKVQEAKKRVELAKISLKSAKESLRIVEKRYKAGLSTITELLDTQTALNKARAGLVNALSSYNQAVAELFFKEGVISNKYTKLEN
ncbi:MAG: TolC family protein [Desulfurobacteriaceae bacterium]